MYKMHLFNGSAVATAACAGAYRPGDRHVVLAFLRQMTGTDHDWEATEAQLNYAGWGRGIRRF
jgi:hypothetical protein